MDPLDLTQSFVERCERFAPVSELSMAFRQALEHMGFRYFACCSHVDPKNPPRHAVVIHNYPQGWVRSYAERKLHEYDPVFQHAEKTILPFYWDAADFRAGLSRSQEQIMREAEAFGLTNGYTVPIHLPWAAGALRASCSVVPDSRQIRFDAYLSVQLIAIYLYATVGCGNGLMAARHTALGSGGLLSVRERQCLELAAYGKSDWAIGQLLKISEHTVHKHIEAAKRHLGVATRVQAIIWAAQLREISLGDVVRAERRNKRVAPRRTRTTPRPNVSVPRPRARGERPIS